MKPPKHVDVGPHRYRVVVVDDGILGDAGQHGHTALDRGVIALNGEQPSTQLADTLLHEVTHALLDTVDLGDEEDALGERICRAFGPGLLALILDNPKLIAYVQSLKP